MIPKLGKNDADTQTPFGKAGAGGGMDLLSLFGDGGGGSGRLEAREERLGISDCVSDPFWALRLGWYGRRPECGVDV